MDLFCLIYMLVFFFGSCCFVVKYVVVVIFVVLIFVLKFIGKIIKMEKEFWFYNKGNLLILVLESREWCNEDNIRK